MRVDFVVLMGWFLIMLSNAQLGDNRYKDASKAMYVLDTQSSAMLQPSGFENPQVSPPWHLDVLDSRDHSQDFFYRYPASGKGVTVYLMSSGVDPNHREFLSRPNEADGTSQSRILRGSSFMGGNSLSDCRGDGTYSAGIVGGEHSGVAKDVFINSVQVMMGCDEADAETSINILKDAVDHIISDYKAPALVLANFALQSTNGVQEQFQRLLDAGIPVVAEAGAGESDACEFSPGDVPGVITVSGTSHIPAFTRVSGFSNYGPCVDLFSPAQDVFGPMPNEQMGSTTSTKAAAAIVAGMAAQFMEIRPNATLNEVREYLFTVSTKNIVTDPNQQVTFLNDFAYLGELGCVLQESKDSAGKRRLQQLTVDQGEGNVLQVDITDLKITAYPPGITGCFDNMGDPAGVYYFVADVDVSTASVLLTPETFIVNNRSGEVLCVEPKETDPCGGFWMQGFVPIEGLQSIDISVDCQIAKNGAKDTLSGDTFPENPPTAIAAASTIIRPQGKMFAVYMEYTGNMAITNESDSVVQMSWSEPVEGIQATDFEFKTNPATNVSVTQVVPVQQGDNHIVLVSMPDRYEGQVKVIFNGQALDIEGNNNTQVPPLTFTKRNGDLVVRPVAWDTCPPNEL